MNINKNRSNRITKSIIIIAVSIVIAIVGTQLINRMFNKGTYSSEEVFGNTEDRFLNEEETIKNDNVGVSNDWLTLSDELTYLM